VGVKGWRRARRGAPHLPPPIPTFPRQGGRRTRGICILRNRLRPRKGLGYLLRVSEIRCLFWGLVLPTQPRVEYMLVWSAWRAGTKGSPDMGTTNDAPCRQYTCSLGGCHEFALFLGPLRRLLFFRRQGRFLLIFSFIFDGFRHGVHSRSLCRGASGQRMMQQRCGETCPQA